jgi:alpha-glucosidase
MKAGTMTLYKTALAARRELQSLRTGSFAWRESRLGTLVFAREGGDETIVCAVNVSADEVELPAGELVLASAPDVRGALMPNTAVWLREERRG